jgi:hypothetical protein
LHPIRELHRDEALPSTTAIFGGELPRQRRRRGEPAVSEQAAVDGGHAPRRMHAAASNKREGEKIT